MMSNSQKPRFYAVRRGRTPGIYRSWDECKAQITGFSDASYKKFSSREEAEEFMQALEPRLMETNLSTGLHIFVDGSFHLESRRFSYGLIAVYHGEEYEECRAFFDEEACVHRNVAGELYGAFRAIQIALEKGSRELHLYYDYAGIEKWATGEWRTKTKLTRRYLNTYNLYKSELTVRFHKIAAHTGHVYNERADQLAKQALIPGGDIVKRV